MKKEQLQEIIASEVKKQLSVIVPKLVKPLVQEAVAGALARLIAEGITNPPPVTSKILKPNVGTGVTQKIPRDNTTTVMNEQSRADLRNKLLSAQDEISTIGGTFGDGILGNILNETATDMVYDNGVPSILDIGDELSGVDVSNIMKDYSGVMSALKKRGMT